MHQWAYAHQDSDREPHNGQQAARRAHCARLCDHTPGKLKVRRLVNFRATASPPRSCIRMLTAPRPAEAAERLNNNNNNNDDDRNDNNNNDNDNYNNNEVDEGFFYFSTTSRH